MASILLLQPVLKQYPTTLPFLSPPNPFPRSISPKSTLLHFLPNNNKPSPIQCSSSSNSISSLTTYEQEEHEEEAETLKSHPPLSQVWREIQGCNDWEGLLDPINPHLRREIIRYGELAQACYDSFDFDPHSKYCGTCKYHPSNFFNNLNMTEDTTGYTITRYLYATSNINLPNFFLHNSKLSNTSVWSPHANWMGYVAVTTDEDQIKRLGRRDIVIAWRGTVTYIEWIYDLKDILCSTNFTTDSTIKVESGFYDLYTKKEHSSSSCSYSSFSAREQILSEVKRLLHFYENEEISITITGHSLGAALAILSAYDISELKLNDVVHPVTVYSFAGPRVGNLKFKERCEDLGVKVLRVINVHDVVPTVPGIITNEKFQFQKYIEDNLSFPWSYAHVGKEIALDHRDSPFLKKEAKKNDLMCAHNLEVHLHLMDGYHGKGERFRLASKRDIALVNKSGDFLRSEYGVPPYWRQDENKGMVRSRDGRWVLPDRPRVEAHPPDMVHHLQQVLKNNHHGNHHLGTT